MKRLAVCSASFALLSAPVFAAVDFEKDVKPILENNCVRCHNPKGTDFEKGDTDFDLSNRAAAMDSGHIKPGNAEKSKVYTTTVLPDDAKKLMPPKNKATGAVERLAKAETETLKAWIDEGAKWPEKVSLVARKKEVASEAGAETALVADLFKKMSANSTEKGTADMKAFTTTIAGSEISFDMVPIPC